MILSQAERNKFASYLEEGAASDEQMAAQSEKCGMATFASSLRREASASRMIAAKLRTIEDLKINGDTNQ